MSYRSLQEACEFYYDPARRAEVIDTFGQIAYLSSGVNHLPTTSLIKEQISREFSNDHFYSSYPGQGGSLLFLASVAFMANELLAGRSGFTIKPDNVCATVGATGGLTAFFDYLVQTGRVRSALVLGLNYSFFSLWCDRAGIEYRILVDPSQEQILPHLDLALDEIRKGRPDVVILTQPANPSGEIYDAEEQLALYETCHELGAWFLVDEVPHMATPHDAEVPHLLASLDSPQFPERLAFVNSFSKSRSLAGVRLGYVLAEHPVIAHMRRFNDSLYWSPGNIAPSGLSIDLVLRVLSASTRRSALEPSARERTIHRGLRRYRRYVKLLAGLSDDLSRRSDCLEYLGADRDWPGTLLRFEAELGEIHRVYAHNWQVFLEILEPLVERVIPSRHGFNHCVRLATDLTEGEFCRHAFLEAGIDFYTERMFSDSDDPGRRQFWVRISCAVDPRVFALGAERLRRFLETGSARRRP